MLKKRKTYKPKGETGTLEHHVKHGNLSYEDAHRISLLLGIPFTPTTTNTTRPLPNGWSIIERKKHNA